MLPYFRKLESDSDFNGDLHGRSGPVPIRRTPPEHLSSVPYAGPRGNQRATMSITELFRRGV